MASAVLARFGGPTDEQANYQQPTLAGDDGEALSEAPQGHCGPHEVEWRSSRKFGDHADRLQPFERERTDPITPVGNRSSIASPSKDRSMR